MRHWHAVGLVLIAGALGGCAVTAPLSPGRPVADARTGAETADAPDVVFLDVALVERPTGDRFLNHELWESGDEQGVPLEAKPALEDNGLRVGQIGGLLPPRLQGLLGSKQSCPDPRRLRAVAEQPTPVLVSAGRPRCRFRFVQHDGERTVDVTRAFCFFEVTPTVEKDGRVRLRFAPRIRHGDPRLETHVVREADGSLRWAVEPREAVEDLTPLAWDLTVTPEEYVLVGARLDCPDTLGPAYFLPDGVPGGVQKLLVLRATRLGGGTPEDGKLEQTPPLALQASWTPRGVSR